MIQVVQCTLKCDGYCITCQFVHFVNQLLRVEWGRQILIGLRASCSRHLVMIWLSTTWVFLVADFVWVLVRWWQTSGEMGWWTVWWRGWKFVVRHEILPAQALSTFPGTLSGSEALLGLTLLSIHSNSWMLSRVKLESAAVLTCPLNMVICWAPCRRESDCFLAILIPLFWSGESVQCTAFKSLLTLDCGNTY